MNGMLYLRRNQFENTKFYTFCLLNIKINIELTFLSFNRHTKYCDKEKKSIRDFSFFIVVQLFQLIIIFLPAMTPLHYNFFSRFF